MSLRARADRWRHKLRSRTAQRLLLLALIAILLGRLALLTYWSRDNLHDPPTSRMLVLMWGLGLIGIAILLRFLRHTFSAPADKPGSK